MDAKRLNPILNVSNLVEEGLGPGHGGRGRSDNTSTFGPRGGESADEGVWISIRVDDTDAEPLIRGERPNG